VDVGSPVEGKTVVGGNFLGICFRALVTFQPADVNVTTGRMHLMVIDFIGVIIQLPDDLVTTVVYWMDLIQCCPRWIERNKCKEKPCT
jgi:hypothetical protein